MADWSEFDGKDAFPHEDAARLNIKGVQVRDFKQLCVDKGFAGFVTKAGVAYFKSHKRQDLIDKKSDAEGCKLFVAPVVGKRGMTACQDPKILKPLQDNLAILREMVAGEVDKDPVPQYSVAEILSAAEWLRAARRAVQDYVDLFTPSGIQGMDQEKLERYQKKGREAARRLTIMLASSQNGFVEVGQEGSSIIELSGNQECSSVRQRLEHLVEFFRTFGKSKWLGGMVADEEFLTKNECCIDILQGLLRPLRLDADKSAPCRALSFGGDGAASPSKEQQDEVGSSTTGAILEKMAMQAEAFAAACRRDARIREEREQLLDEKLDALRSFGQAANDVQRALNAFLLARADEIDEADSSTMTKFIARSEAHEVHQLLEQFRDDAMKESLRREMFVLQGPGPAGTRTPTSTENEYEIPAASGQGA